MQRMRSNGQAFKRRDEQGRQQTGALWAGVAQQSTQRSQIIDQQRSEAAQLSNSIRSSKA